MMIKRTLSLILAVAVLTISLYGLGVYRNNAASEPVAADAVKSSFDRSVNWLADNRSQIYSDHNTALWYMLKRASEVSADPELTAIYTEYKRLVLDRQPRTVWTPYFEPRYRPRVPDIAEMVSLRDYQLFFIYGLSCDSDLGSEPIIRQQLSADFCSLHYLKTRCVTHQQMGVLMINERQCEDTGNLSAELVDIIESELTWDFRVTDSYLQRVLMLLESNRRDLVLHSWVRRVIEAQQQDGGWGDFHPFISFGEKQIGTRSTRPAIGPLTSDFHATAQGILIMAILQAEN